MDIIQEKPEINEEQPTAARDLAVIEQKDLAGILVVDEQLPADFYSNGDYKEQARMAIKATSGLVYSMTDAGDKAAKADATAINKYLKGLDGYVNTTFKAQTEAVTIWKDGWKSLIKQLAANRQAIIDQHEEQRKKKLDTIRDQLNAHLLTCWDTLGVEPSFRDGDIAPLVKFGSATGTGQLTKKAQDFCQNIASTNLAWQNTIQARHLILENRCLKEGIKPPLKQVHFGGVFFADEQAFNAKLEELITAELERIEESRRQLEKELAEKNQRDIDAALAVQKTEFEGAKKLEAFKREQDALRERAWDQPTETPIADKKHPDVPKPPAATVRGKRTVSFNVNFQLAIPSRIGNDRVKELLLAKLPADVKGWIQSIQFAEDDSHA